jgi:hypothetical protein
MQVWLTATKVHSGFGFDGLGHYPLASFGALSFMMNFSMLLEVFAGAALTGVVSKKLVGEALIARART